MTHWSVWHMLYFILRWILPLLVTVHVLMHKRETASCAGWIGICWIAPLLGTLLYLMFGINRVRRRAQKLVNQHLWDGRESLAQYRQGVTGGFAPLAAMLGRLTERPLMRGNSVTCLHDGDNAYPAMLEAIESAKTSVILCSYIFRDDSVGRAFADALVAAKARGVEVRVLVDGIGSGYFYCRIARRLRREGVPCEQFMHSVWPWRMPFINLRNHRKILVVDGAVGFMGGLNIGEENMLRLRTKLPVADTHFRLEGPVVHQLSVAFAWDWSFTTGEELRGESYMPVPSTAGDIPMRVVTSGPDADLEKIEYGMLQAFALARRQIWIMTPYFLPDDRFATELNLAALRGVSIDIVVPRSSNHALIDYARDANLRSLLDAGCRVWMADPPFNHSKLMVVDEEWSFVGSANIDMRSLRLNFEVNLEVYDLALAKDLTNFMKSRPRSRLTHHDLDSLALLKRLRNSAVRLFLPYL